MPGKTEPRYAWKALMSTRLLIVGYIATISVPPIWLLAGNGEVGFEGAQGICLKSITVGAVEGV